MSLICLIIILILPFFLLSHLSFQQKDDSLNFGWHRQHVWRLGRPTGCNAGLISCPCLISNKPFSLSLQSCVGVSWNTPKAWCWRSESVCACVFQHLSLLRECFSCSLDQFTEEGVLFIWCGSSSNTFPVRGGRSHTTSDLCSPASHRRPAFRDGCVCVHREAQSCSSSFYLYRLWLGQRS